MWQRWEEMAWHAVPAVIGAIGAACIWVVRRLLTNQAQIELLKAEIQHRDQLRSEDREALAEVRSDVKEIRSALIGDKK